MIFGIGPEDIPVAAFLPPVGHGPGIAGLLVFINSAELAFIQPFKSHFSAAEAGVCIIIVGNLINKLAGAQLAGPVILHLVRRGCFILSQGIIGVAAILQLAPEQRLIYFVIIPCFTAFRTHGPVVTLFRFHGIRTRAIPDSLGCDCVLLRRRQILAVLGIIGNSPGSGTGILRPGIPGQVGDGDFAFYVIILHPAYIQVHSGVVADCYFRAAVHSQDAAVAGTRNPASQIDPSALCIDIFYHKVLVLGIVVYLHNIFECTDGFIVYNLSPVVHLIHGAALNRRLISGYGQLFKIGIFRDIRLVSAESALDQPVYVNIRGSDVNAVAGDPAGLRMGNIRSGALHVYIDPGTLNGIVGTAVPHFCNLLLNGFTVQFLRPSADIDDTVHEILGNTAFGSGHLNRPACDVHAPDGIAGADQNIPAGIMDAHFTVIICNVSGHGHIGDRPVNALVKISVFDLHFVAGPVFIVHKDSADPAGCRIILELCKSSLAAFILVQVVNFFIGSHADALETDLAAGISHADAVQFQESIGIIVHLSPWHTAGIQAAAAIQGIRMNHDVAAADQYLRHFHIPHSDPAGFINTDSLAVLSHVFVQAMFFHVLQNTLALLYIPVVSCGFLRVAANPVILQQLFHSSQLVPQLGSIIHGPGFDVILADFYRGAFRADNQPVFGAVCRGQSIRQGAAADLNDCLVMDACL